MRFSNPYWSTKIKIELLSKWIIVHSIIYYELNENLVPDKMFDNNSKQLVTLISQNKKDFKQSRWFYVLKDFDGNTGFDLYKKLKKSDKKALMDLSYYLIDKYGEENQ